MISGSNISAKLSFLVTLKISCKILKNGGGVGKNVKSIFAKSRGFVDFLMFLCNKMSKLDAIQL